jgi:hypothetical protein
MALVSFKPLAVSHGPIGRDLSLVLAAAHQALRISVASLAIGASNSHRIQRVERGASAALSCLVHLQEQVQGVLQRVRVLGDNVDALRASHERVASLAAQSAQQLRVHDDALRVHSQALTTLLERRNQVDLNVDLLSTLTALVVAAAAGAPLRWGAFAVLRALCGTQVGSSPWQTLTRLAVTAAQCLLFAHALRSVRALAARAGLRSALPAATEGLLGAVYDCWYLLVGEGAGSLRQVPSLTVGGVPTSAPEEAGGVRGISRLHSSSPPSSQALFARRSGSVGHLFDVQKRAPLSISGLRLAVPTHRP